VEDEPLMKIRAASAEDAAAVAAIYAPYVIGTAVSFEERAPSVNEMAERIENSHVWLVAEDDSGVQGYAYAARFHPRPAYRWSAEVSIYLSEHARGRGVGKRLLRELLDGLVARGLVNAFAGTTLPNAASVGLFESFGFEKITHQKKVGFKLGRWHDVGWWQLQLRDASVPPPEIE
jgi:L-amino acid N-acyltransferase YncA